MQMLIQWDNQFDLYNSIVCLVIRESATFVLPLHVTSTRLQKCYEKSFITKTERTTIMNFIKTTKNWL